MKLLALPFLLLIAACGGQPHRQSGEPVAVLPVPAAAETQPYPAGRRGGYYLDDGPLGEIPVDLAALPDAVPRNEALHRFANRPYSVLGRDYVPLQTTQAYRQTGTASWYGRRYHGQKTSSGEHYDMFAMTAAHPILPIPSYARVTRPDNGKSVVVRINDRGPFLHERVIDLSYAAAWKLGIVERGSGAVVVESILSDRPAAVVSPRVRNATATESANPSRDGGVLVNVEEKNGHYLQLGAFGNLENAESLKVKLARAIGDLGEKLTIRSTGNLHRLQLGPWLDAAEARRVAEQIKLAFELPSVLVK